MLLCTLCFSQPQDSIFINNDIQLAKLADSVYIHITWNSDPQFGRFPSNGLILVKNGHGLLVDTAMNNHTTKQLVQYIQDSLNVKIDKVIIGHYHNDCLGGLEYLHKIGVKSVANDFTIQKCKELELEIPHQGFTDSLELNFWGEPVVCKYFGGGHSFDNIVVWLPTKKILFGGCLVKSMQSRTLGNLTDAVVDEWVHTIAKLMTSINDLKIVIPGHGQSGDQELLPHTLNLVKAHKAASH